MMLDFADQRLALRAGLTLAVAAYGRVDRVACVLATGVALQVRLDNKLSRAIARAEGSVPRLGLPNARR